MSYVLAFLGFAALILLHEFGHFVAAKAVGMRVERFSLFFGPLLVKVRRGETEYGIGPIPLGGYVKISGMNPMEELPPEVRPRAYYNQPVWKRVVVIMAGPTVNLLIAFLIIWILLLSHGQDVISTRVGAVVKGSPAAAATLRAGDRIVSVDGVGGSVAAIRRRIASHRCAGREQPGCLAAMPATVIVRRGTRTLTLRVRPRFDATEHQPLLGVMFSLGHQRLGPVTAASRTISGLWSVTRATVSVVGRIFEPQERRQLSGVVGGYTVTQERFATDTTLALETLALISLSLAVINLFPFLPLDGGHVFWAVAEKVRGRRIPFSVMERAGFVGYALIVLLFVIGLTNDLSRLSSGGFGVH